MANAKDLLSAVGNFPRAESVTADKRKMGKIWRLVAVISDVCRTELFGLVQNSGNCPWLAVDKVLGILIMRPSLGG